MLVVIGVFILAFTEGVITDKQKCKLPSILSPTSPVGPEGMLGDSCGKDDKKGKKYPPVYQCGDSCVKHNKEGKKCPPECQCGCRKHDEKEDKNVPVYHCGDSCVKHNKEGKKCPPECQCGCREQDEKEDKSAPVYQCGDSCVKHNKEGKKCPPECQCGCREQDEKEEKSTPECQCGCEKQEDEEKKCSNCGPGYATPLDAFYNGPREEILYVICVQPDKTKQDYLATIDVNPNSPTYMQVIARTSTGRAGDELHHIGWNVCSSCHDKHSLKRDTLVMPAFISGRVYLVDVGKNPRKPELKKVIESSKMRSFNCTYPHTPHCAPTGEIMISTLGDNDENGKGDYILINSDTLEMTGTWTKGNVAKFGYDFWYQPYHDVMIGTEFGKPARFITGFHPEDVGNPDLYGQSLNVFSWSTHELKQVIDLGSDGIAPFEIRFLHDPKSSQGFVGCAVGGNLFRFYKKCDGTWGAVKAIDIPAQTICKDGVESNVTALAGDILISLDDKYLYVSLWLRGEIRQYDISDCENPKLTGRIQIGGLVASDPDTKLVGVDEDSEEYPKPVTVKGKTLQGSPQMMQLSLDGKRLYVTPSLVSPWDSQFYPNLIKEGAWLIKIDVDREHGGMKLDPDFLVDFGCEPDGPVLAHEIRYPGGDCTSDIWLVKE